MPLLTVRKATKTFGGVAAVKDVSLTVEEGEILGIMGPNGSGKTTLFNLVSGVFYPDSGDIFFQDERTNKLPPHQLCHRGLARTFQLVRPFLGLTAEENVLVGLGYGRDRLSGSQGARQGRRTFDFGRFGGPVESSREHSDGDGSKAPRIGPRPGDRAETFIARRIHGGIDPD